MDKWVTYGKFDGQELFTAKETPLMPGVKTTIKDGVYYGATCVQAWAAWARCGCRARP